MLAAHEPVAAQQSLTQAGAPATITLQQQISRDITFTCIQDVTGPNSEVLRVQWNSSKQCATVAQRDLYGDFDLDFSWKQRFR